MAIFSVVVVSVVDIFLVSLSATKKVFNQQGILDSGRFVLESISKEIRMSQINTPAGGPYTELDIVNSRGQNIKYSFSNECEVGSCLVPSKMDMVGYFYVQTSTGNVFMPPRVTVVMTLSNKNVAAEEQAIVHLQTTVSSREYTQ